MPAELAAAYANPPTFNLGFETVTLLAATWIDLAWHRLTAEQAGAVDDVAAFEAAALAEVGLDIDTIPPRYRGPYFNHIFAGGYSAGYYSYLWSEVLDADTCDWFREHADRPARRGPALPRRAAEPGWQPAGNGAVRGIPRPPTPDRALAGPSRSELMCSVCPPRLRTPPRTLHSLSDSALATAGANQDKGCKASWGPDCGRGPVATGDYDVGSAMLTTKGPPCRSFPVI